MRSNCINIYLFFTLFILSSLTIFRLFLKFRPENVPIVYHDSNQLASTMSSSSVTRSISRMSKIFQNLEEVNGRKRLVVVGHRGMGKNILNLNMEKDGEVRPHSIMENTIASFNRALENLADFVEFDVQVSKDGHPVLYHDKYIIAENENPHLIKDLTLEEFLSFNSKNSKSVKTLLRYSNSHTAVKWNVHENDDFCTLKTFFASCAPNLGANLEIKFAEEQSSAIYEQEINRMLNPILKVVDEFARDRKIFFSSFIPEAVIQLRKRQDKYPVFFLTDGGETITDDARMNSIPAAIDLCLKHGLDGIVSEVRALIKHPFEIKNVKDSGLTLLTYGNLNNFSEVIHFQHLSGVDGVIVDNVKDMFLAAKNISSQQISPEKFLPHNLPALLALERNI